MTTTNPRFSPPSADDERRSIENEADAVRAELVHTLEELDLRRHHAVDVRYQVRAHKGGLVATGVAALLALAIGAVAFVRRITHAREHRRVERYEMVRRLWEHPEDVARAKPRSSFVFSLGRTVVLGLVSRALRSRSSRRIAAAQTA